MKINLWNASLVPGEEEEKGEGQGLGQVYDRGCQEAATSWRCWNSCRREPHTFPEEECPDGCFGNCAAQFSSCMENKKCPWNGAKPSRVILCDHSQGGMQQSQRKTHGPAHQERRDGRIFGLDQEERLSRKVTLAQAHRSGQSKSKL